MATNRLATVLEKADLAVSDLSDNGGYLNPIMADTFIRMLIEQPTILNQIRVVPMNAPTMKLNKIGFGSRILHAAPSSGTALAASKRSKPTTEQVSLTTKEIMAEVHIPYDVLEDNIERGRLEDTIMELIAERAALDLEELIITGDDTSGDAYLALLDGLLVQSTSHVVSYAGTTGAITKAIWKAGIKAMPNKYLRRKSEMRFWCSPHTEIEWADQFAGHGSIGGYQSMQKDWEGYPAYGIPVQSAALMPNSNYLLTYPKNIIWGVQRKIMIETDRDIRTRVLIVVLTMRADLKYEEEDAVVKATDLHPDGTTTTTTTTTGA